LATATPLTVTSSTATTISHDYHGIISRTNQIDYFLINVPAAGTLSVSIAVLPCANLCLAQISPRKQQCSTQPATRSAYQHHQHYK
jgi:hypothetical protein